MNKILLLAHSHFRKNKGTSVGLVALMLLASLLFSLSLLVLTDAYPVARKEAERLDSGDGFFRITENIDGIDEAFFDEILAADTARHFTYSCLSYTTTVPFGDGTMSIALQISDMSAFNKAMANSEIVSEDTSIRSDYVYLPYQFNVSGGYEIGDDYSIEIQSQKYDFKIKGFLTTPYFGCNNSGSYEFVVDDKTYDEMNSFDGAGKSIVVIYELKDGVDQSAFAIRTGNKIVEKNPGSNPVHMELERTLENRTFMSKIMVIAFMTVSMIVLLVVLMMLINSIRNYIRQNMKVIGALKAVGYTSSDIRNSLLILFMILAVTGAVAGIILSYILMPVAAKIAVGQMGIPYQISFKVMPMIIVFFLMIIFTALVTFIALLRIRKIDPIVALRDGTENHDFTKNRIRLDRSSFNLNISLALKTALFNKRQNITTFIITGVMVFMCTIGLLMYQNFNVDPKLGMLSFEYCAGLGSFDNETKDEAQEYLQSLDGVHNVRNMINLFFNYGEEDRLYTYIAYDLDGLNNRNVCYDGRLPEYDNEIVVSGSFGRAYGFEIGDTIELTYGDNKFDYLITGFIQTTNNGGREAYMSVDAASRIADLSSAPGYFYFDCDEETAEAAQKVLDKCEEKFGDHMIAKMNFYEIIDGALTTFKGISTLMLAMMCTMSALVILLVLYLLIKTLIFNKKKDYGIYKAIGFTSRELVLQTAISFMPAIIISVVISSVLSYFYANNFMNIVMSSFGIVKADFDIPVAGVIMVAVGMILVSFLFAVFESRKIRKIEAYNMLVAE